jgi:putative aldouronate transport system substrate-binding protein
MKKVLRKRFTSLILVGAMILSLTACGNKTDKTVGKETASDVTGEQTESSQSETKDSGFLISDEPIELTAHIHNASVEVLSDEWVIEKKAGEMTNIFLKGTASVNVTDSNDAFNLMIASGEIPDIVGGTDISLNKFGMEGAFVSLEDLIAENAPNITKMLNDNPDVRAAITAVDGHIYYLPTLEDSQVSQTWFIRQDWLDKLNLKVPTTVDELHDVLVAFRDGDPNGNGQKDEVGYLNRNGMGSDLTGNITALFSLFGVNSTFYVDENDKIQLGAYSPEFKVAMKGVSQWYEEGLIDPEIFTRLQNARDVLFSANNGGLTHDWYPSTSGYNTKLTEHVPGFKLVGILPPADINGNQWEVESRKTVTGIGTAISATNKYPVETIKYLDFWFSPEGERLMTYGIEGEHYTLVDGKPVYTDKVLNNTNPINTYMKSLGGQQYQIAHVNLSEYETFMMSEEGTQVLELYRTSGVINKLYPKLPAFSLNESELDIIQSKWTVITTYIQENIAAWTFDGSTIDSSFDKYMNDIKKMGIDEVLGAYQAAYDRSKK